MAEFPWLTAIGPDPIWAIVPTIVIPFAIIGAILSGIATFIAALFGVKLHTEGPKRLLELLLKPKILFWALASNLLIWGSIAAYKWWDQSPSFLWWIKYKNQNEASQVDYTKIPDLAATDAQQQPPEKITVAQMWRSDVGKGSFGGISRAGDSLFFGTRDGHIYELAAEDGKLRRSFFIGSPVTPKPIIWDQSLYVGEGEHTTAGARLYRFDLQSGKLASFHATEGHTQSEPLLDTGFANPRLYLAAGKDGVYALDAKTLEPLWHETMGHVDSKPLLAGDLLYVATAKEREDSDRNHAAFALDKHTGATVWRSALPASGWFAPVHIEGEVCFGSGEMQKPRDFGQLTCFDALTGDPSLALTFKGSVNAAPQLVGNHIIVATVTGEVCLLQANPLQRLWCQNYPAPALNYARPIFDSHGNLVYPSKDGLLFLDQKTGEILYQWQPTEEEGSWQKHIWGIHVEGDDIFLADYSGSVRRLRVRYLEAHARDDEGQ